MIRAFKAEPPPQPVCAGLQWRSGGEKLVSAMSSSRSVALLSLVFSLAVSGCEDGGSDNAGSNADCGVEGCLIVAPDRDNQDLFGSAIAIDGDRMVVGSIVSDPVTNAGAVYIYRLIEGNWRIEQKIQIESPLPGGGDLFGGSVAILGNRIAVGAQGNGWVDPDDDDDEIDAARAGLVLIFEPDVDGNWAQVQQIRTDGPNLYTPAEDDFFGVSVALGGDWLVIGSYLENANGTDSGSVYVYRHDGSEYGFDQKLDMSNNGANDRFGWDVAVDGDILIASAIYDAFFFGGNQSGSVAVFRHDGTSWNEEQVLVTPFPYVPLDQFGISIDVDAGNEMIVVGAHQRSHYPNVDSCNAVFVPCVNACDPLDIPCQVACFGPYQICYVEDAVAEQGVVFVYEIVDPDSPDGPWSHYNFPDEVKRIEPEVPSTKLLFGGSVNIDAGRILVGTKMDDEKGQRAGATYVYEYDALSDEWVEEHKLTAPDATTGDSFGFATAIEGDDVLVGAPEAGPGNDASGAVYQFGL